MQRIVIQVQQLSPRLQYVCDIIFTHYLNIPFSISTKNEPLPSNISISYGLTPNDPQRSLLIPSTGLIEESTIREIDFSFHKADNLPKLFYIPDGYTDLDFDLFAAVFFLLSRYEEYLDTEFDMYGRYQSKNSAAVNHDFIELPIVELWIRMLCNLLNQKFKTDYRLSGSYSCQPTLDIDLPYAFHLKGWKTYFGGLRDLFKLDALTLSSRIHYLKSNKDPFDTYDYIKNLLAQFPVKPKIFILNKFQSPLDENHLANSPDLVELIQNLSSWADIGIHPSTSAGHNLEKIQEEIKFVEQHLSQKIENSRQHFLKFILPHTYRALIQCGIKHDYSMSYPDRLGFRAGTARSYPWYDLESETSTELMIHPNVAMDVTLRRYLGLKPKEAIDRCKALSKIIREVNGQFTFIWHNSSLSNAYGWKNWREVFEILCRM